MRGLGERLSTNSLLGAMALLFVIYFPLHTGWWALALGLIGGWLWQRLPRPLPAPKLTAAFLLGLLLSFLFHANSGRPVVKHFVWPGGGSVKAGL
ncbi:MAG: hypothetical protein LWX11_11900, partial [Firmicutes bacterium]|nr:hypothetical protein [Bacillota bacterium]